jgi:hypothetical protein
MRIDPTKGRTDPLLFLFSFSQKTPIFFFSFFFSENTNSLSNILFSKLCVFFKRSYIFKNEFYFFGYYNIITKVLKYQWGK